MDHNNTDGNNNMATMEDDMKSEPISAEAYTEKIRVYAESIKAGMDNLIQEMKNDIKSKR